MPIHKVISKERIPVKIYSDQIDPNALEQLVCAAKVPGAFHHVASMPDAHLGMGIAIGTVLVTRGAIVPNAVGVDIGCGMVAQKFKVRAKDIKDKLVSIHQTIKGTIPVGHNGRKRIPEEYCDFYDAHVGEHTEELSKEIHERAPSKFGTLGGGNHFIELCEDEEGFVWMVLHSGSRNIGMRIGLHYSRLARELNERWNSEGPRDMAFLPDDSDEGQAYIKDMLWAQAYALYSRGKMCKDIIEILSGEGIEADDVLVNIHHNFARLENHFGSNVWVHRKGATPARKGQLGIVPGSMSAGSYIVEGLGNPDSFMSCSHGAGRVMSRKRAVKEIKMDVFEKQMEGIVADVCKRTLDEAPDAYRNLERVMENQSDLVKPVHRLRTILNVKG